MAVAGTLFALLRNPDERVILACYADSLAQEHSRRREHWSPNTPSCWASRCRPTRHLLPGGPLDGHDGGLLAADYEDSFLPTGSMGGSPEDALDTACGLYLADPTAWT